MPPQVSSARRARPALGPRPRLRLRASRTRPIETAASGASERSLSVVGRNGGYCPGLYLGRRRTARAAACFFARRHPAAERPCRARRWPPSPTRGRRSSTWWSTTTLTKRSALSGMPAAGPCLCTATGAFADRRMRLLRACTHSVMLRPSQGIFLPWCVTQHSSSALIHAAALTPRCRRAAAGSRRA